MKSTTITLIALSALMIAACSTLKKNTKSNASPAPATTTSSTPVKPATTESIFFTKPANGIFAPGNEELTAIRATYKDVTMKTLTEGHALYIGTCTSCHEAVSIYSIKETMWPRILTDMAEKAQITNAQKDAIDKYFLAIKATQPKETK